MTAMKKDEYASLQAAAARAHSAVAQRAYSTMEIKSIDDDQRIITGIASTPSVDRMGDIVEPEGAEFKLPLPLLWQHSSREPVGNVIAAKVSKDGITITAQFAKVDEPPSLKEELDRAWAKVKAKLVRGLSIGFKPIESSFLEDTGGIRFLRWAWIELSAVTIPANAEATISTIKSLDQQYQRAEQGKSAALPIKRPSTTSSGATESRKTNTKEGNTMTTAENIAAFEAKRAAAQARMTALMEAAQTAGVTLDQAQSEEYDNLDGEIKSVDGHLVRLKRLEQISVSKAVQVTPQVGHDSSLSEQARGGNIVAVHRNLPKGTAFTRYVQCLALSKGNIMHAAEMAKQYEHDTPEVAAVLKMAVNLGTTAILKAAVNVGTTAASTWAAPLVQYQDMVSEFIELLRPQTILGRIQGLRRVPFNIRVPRTTAGATGGWVGENAPKPVSSMAFDSITLGFSKVAVIVALTEELVRFSNPSAEAVVRQELIDALTQLIDVSFIDPNRAAVANVSPASITNGISPVNSTGTSVATVTANIQSLFANFATNNISLDGAVWIMNPRTALGLSMLRTAQDVFAFPTISMTGGLFMGLPVIVSGNVPISAISATETFAILLKPNEIYLADDGGVEIDISREASVQMNDAPTAGAQSLVSFWQNNLVGLRAEHFINWRRRRDAAVQVWDGLRI